jgi:cytochrome c553
MRNRGVVRAQARGWVFMAVVWAAVPAWAQAPSAPAAPEAAATAAVRDTMAQRMQACVMCHGQQGRATRTGYFPRIAGAHRKFGSSGLSVGDLRPI